MVTIFNIPFLVGSLILTVICGPFSAILLVYVQTRNIDEAIGRTFSLFFGGQVSALSGVSALTLLSVAFFYAIYMIRRTRLRLLAAEASLASLLPQGEETFHRIFGRVCRVGPPAALGSLVIACLILLNGPKAVVERAFMAYGTDPARVAFVVIVMPLWLLIFGTFAWVYFGSVLGLRDVGKTPLKMKPFHEDRMLGMKPIGSLSLSLASMYFIGLSILSVIPIVLSQDPAHSVFTWLLVVFTLLGVVLFFLPLNAFHKKMLEVKRQEQETLRVKLFKSVQTQDESGTRLSESSPLDDMRDELIRLSRTLTATATEKEVSAIATWPFDPPILGRLGAMVISIITLIIGNLVLTWIKGLLGIK